MENKTGNVRAYSALILAGGQASRMGGVDKGWVRLGQTPLIRCSLAALSRQAEPPRQVLISANRHLDDYAALGVPVLPDVLSGSLGPLAGLHAAQLSPLLSTGEPLLVISVDTVRLPDNFASRLLDALAAGHDAVSASDSERWHPTLMMVRTGQAASLADYLLGGGRSIRGWLGGLRHATVAFGQPFPNLNTLDDVASLAAGQGGVAPD